MSFNFGNSATIPTEWSFENGNGASFTQPYATSAHTNPEAANGTPKYTAIAGFGVTQPGSVDRRPESCIDTLIFNDFSTNADFFSNLEMRFPSITEEDGGLVSVDVRLPS